MALTYLAIAVIKNLPNWKDSDVAIYQAKHTGFSFENLSDQQKVVAISVTMLNVAIITGCQVPNNERHLEILKTEVRKFISENNCFSKLTVEEIITAFRFNAAGKFDEKIKHWNNMFNLDYLGEILTKYVSLRRSVELKEEREWLCINLLERPTEPKLSDEEAIQFSIDRWNETKDYMFIESRVYNILNKQGNIKFNDDEKEQIRTEAKIKYRSIEWVYFELIEHIGRENVVQSISKKIAVSQFFTSKKEIGYNP